jgi:hypothetical protein
MTIGGKPAQLDLRHEYGSLYAHVPIEIYRNRSLLLTRSVVRAYQCGLWSNEELTPQSSNALLEVMSACLWRNLGLKRLRQTLQSRDPGSLADTSALIFVTHREEALQISLSFHRALYHELRADDQLGQGRFVTLQKEIFEELGLLCPIPEVRPAAELNREEWYVRINDVRLPVMSINERRSASATILAALKRQLMSEPLTLFTSQGVERNLDFLRASSPVLVEEVLRRVGMNVICRVLEALIQERLPLTNLGRILDMLTFARGTYQVDTSKYIIFTSDAETPILKPTQEKRVTVEDYVRAVRTNLKREITYRYAKWGIGASPQGAATCSATRTPTPNEAPSSGWRCR